MVNEKHPDFPKYKAEWEKLWQDYKKDMGSIEKKEQNKNSGKDGEGAMRTKKLHLAIHSLHQKYSYLFE